MRELRFRSSAPGMVVGDAAHGEIRAFNTVYVPLRLYLSAGCAWCRPSRNCG